MAARRLTARDLRVATVADALVVERTRVPGMNEGIFYPESRLRLSAGGPKPVPAPAASLRDRPTTGNPRLLVLLVDFSDQPGARPESDFQSMLFSSGTFKTGSMRDFYKENSYGQLDVDGEVIGWLRLPGTYASYVGSSTGMGTYPNNASKMVEDAVNLASSTVDFSKFDKDGDGFLDGLLVVHSGGGAEVDTDPNTRRQKIWSHQGNITAPLTFNGVTAFSYLTIPEDCKVGVCCHEFGHMLGLPDLYDTTTLSEGVGAWCVMGGGVWNNDGLTPSHFCAWSKARLNWVRPTVVAAASKLSIPPVETNRGAVYRLWAGGAAGDEYFLLENRQLLGFDAQQVGAGLLIWHVDDTQTNNNHPGSYWVGLRQADGKQDLETNGDQGDAGDPFPGASGNTTFDGASNPNSNDKFGNPTPVAVRNIAPSGTTIACDVTV